MIVVTCLYLGVVLHTFEMTFYLKDFTYNSANGYMDFSQITNSIWVTIITMTTVGYGDGYPVTHYGRFVSVLACLIGMLLVSIMVVALSTLAEFSQEQSRAYNEIQKVINHDHLAKYAVDLVSS